MPFHTDSEGNGVRPGEDAHETMSNHIRFRLETRELAVAVRDVAEVVDPGEIALTPLPGAPRHLLGLFGLRGGLIPLLDVRAVFGDPPALVTDRSRILVIVADHGPVGLLVDTLGVVDEIDDETLIPPTGQVDDAALAPYVTGFVERSGARLHVVDPLSLIYAPRESR